MMNRAITLVGKRWDILERLSERRYYVSELASELGRKVPGASIYLQELLEQGLVEFEQTEGDRRKYYHLSDRGLRIYRAIVEAASDQREEPGFEEWKVEEILEIALDDGFPRGLRTSYSREFVKTCRDHPTRVVENEGARSLLRQIASDPPTDRDMVLRELRPGLRAILKGLSHKGEREDWVWGEIYPSLFKHVEMNISSGSEALSWALRTVAELAEAADEDQREGIRRDMLRLYFSERARVDGEAARIITGALKGLFSRALLAQAKSKAKEKNPKIRLKGVKLLQELRNCLT